MPSNWGNSRPHKIPGATSKRLRQEGALERLLKQSHRREDQNREVDILQRKLGRS